MGGRWGQDCSHKAFLFQISQKQEMAENAHSHKTAQLVSRLGGGVGGGQCQGSRGHPCHLSSQPAVMTVSRGSISLVKNALQSPSHCEQSRKGLYLTVENLLLGKNALKEMIVTSHGTFHFSWDNLGIYWSKSTIQERNASAFS